MSIRRCSLPFLAAVLLLALPAQAGARGHVPLAVQTGADEVAELAVSQAGAERATATGCHRVARLQWRCVITEYGVLVLSDPNVEEGEIIEHLRKRTFAYHLLIILDQRGQVQAMHAFWWDGQSDAVRRATSAG
jgi:hypothetical protein